MKQLGFGRRVAETTGPDAILETARDNATLWELVAKITF